MLLVRPELLLSMPGELEWVWILLVVVILFGGKKIPELAKGLGKGIHDFKQAKDGIQQEIENGMKGGEIAPKPVESSQARPASAVQDTIIEIPSKD
ncbi:MAG TPA: twin-arginine translocase TatA/TatE family subunit [Edaphocola sp.]|nr:twin-arginine translocase TatA/TatE family subunit [Edaphocola sp.]